jgi:hypothetical protein
LKRRRKLPDIPDLSSLEEYEEYNNAELAEFLTERLGWEVTEEQIAVLRKKIGR